MTICLPFSSGRSFDIKGVAYIGLMYFGAISSYYMFSKALTIMNIVCFYLHYLF